uniref:Uncharacterized protein n=1 Tax=Chaetoceros debilis TaxID=122233 RepID=A0A7S3QJT3_9STRA|mmetsp:Transcript_4900/g.7175  ORF Transcript_4900/g.7175 Transcript_4900/m.7175 type:complete len:140 (-) Transcript_4900:844-1263(-)|eukprot:CAMPEP_0194122008 /NCGR_PEP_ID=MMETSP0150-20130528/48946_1 /TAXON_ID=122233 /ORGANISM="Chaetoceros debilis, Strain MM31A-1" /LENGTH=139 /DNA_ID=CAMNT_0038814671 /DNA_START=231 /DNA_END=650 /DNA_ORIENTATION=-
MNIGSEYTSLPPEYAIWLIVLKHCDISATKSLTLMSELGRIASMTAENKWKLVEDEVISVRDLKRLCNKSENDIHREYLQRLVETGLRSLESINIHVTPRIFEIYNPVFLCAIDRLVEMEFHIDCQERREDSDPTAVFK